MDKFAIIFALLLALGVTASVDAEKKKTPDVAVEASKLSGMASKNGRILFYMPLVSKSMKITFMPLAEELARRGHEVVVIMPHEAKSKERLLVIRNNSPFDELTKEISKKLLSGDPSGSVTNIFPMLQGALDSNDNALGDPQLRAELDKGFDVVLVSSFFCSESGYYLAKRSNAALALYFTGQVSLSFMDWAVGQPHNPAYLPFLMYDVPAPFTFMQRVVNTIMSYAFQIMRDYVLISRSEALLDKHFPGEQRMSLLDIERNTSLVLHYGHPMILDGMRPLSPNFQYIGMMNCKEAQPLPKDLADFMDSANEHGVIFVSFGSVLQAKSMSEERRKMLIKVFGSLKQKVIWKWETEEMADKPDNVKLSKWLPQQDILGHPNTKLFITHAGQSSIQETLCHQKPVVAVPLFGDQPSNAKEAARVGYGTQIRFDELTEEDLLKNIREVLDNPKYMQVAQQYGSILNDQITRPMERAVWWLEFLIRHPGKNHMRSPVHDLAWYEYLLLDVILFLVTIVTLVILAIYTLCRLFLCRKKSTKGNSNGLIGNGVKGTKKTN